MPPSSSLNSEATPDNVASFRTTHWSIVLAASQQESQEATEALEKLCRAYWYPLYAYKRRRGHDIHEAEDLTQEFFTRLLEKNLGPGCTTRKEWQLMPTKHSKTINTKIPHPWTWIRTEEQMKTRNPAFTLIELLAPNDLYYDPRDKWGGAQHIPAIDGP